MSTTYSPAHDYTKFITGEVSVLDRHSISRSRSASRSASRLHSTGQMNPYAAEFLGPREEEEDDATRIYEELGGKPSTDYAQAKNRNLAISFVSM